MTKFDAPYQRGVVAYRAKQYDTAALLFKAAAGKNARSNTLYDLGNTQLRQGQIEDAIVSYRAALKQKPDDIATQHNLAIALKILAQEQQKQNQQQEKSQQSQNKKNNGGGQSKQPDKGRAQDQQHSAQSSQQAANRSSQQNDQPTGDKKAAQQQGKQQQASPGKVQQHAGQSTASRSAQGEMRPPNPQYGVAAMAPPRTQRDVNADQWLTRVQSDPGSFLKNQFMIEDQESGLKQGTPPR
jgi:tetratricopeptide (TPR) repeat protein